MLSQVGRLREVLAERDEQPYTRWPTAWLAATGSRSSQAPASLCVLDGLSGRDLLNKRTHLSSRRSGQPLKAEACRPGHARRPVWQVAQVPAWGWQARDIGKATCVISLAGLLLCATHILRDHKGVPQLPEQHQAWGPPRSAPCRAGPMRPSRPPAPAPPSSTGAGGRPAQALRRRVGQATSPLGEQTLRADPKGPQAL